MRRRAEPYGESLLTKAVKAVFAFVKLAEFEILFVLFFLIAYIIFKDLLLSSTWLLFFQMWLELELLVDYWDSEYT
ncbi:hypothetical protein AMTRI_Chr06g172550 [Amborella trichopoda]